MLGNDPFDIALQELTAIRRDIGELITIVDDLTLEMRGVNTELAKLVHARSANRQTL